MTTESKRLRDNAAELRAKATELQAKAEQIEAGMIADFKHGDVFQSYEGTTIIPVAHSIAFDKWSILGLGDGARPVQPYAGAEYSKETLLSYLNAGWNQKFRKVGVLTWIVT